MDDYDTTKVDEVVLALLHLNAHTDHGITRAWKGFDWGVMEWLHARGLISDPKSKAKSVVLTEEGIRRAEELFRRYLPRASEGDSDAGARRAREHPPVARWGIRSQEV